MMARNDLAGDIVRTYHIRCYHADFSVSDCSVFLYDNGDVMFCGLEPMTDQYFRSKSNRQQASEILRTSRRNKYKIQRQDMINDRLETQFILNGKKY